MPAAIALGAVIIALLVLLLLYSGEYLGKAIAQLIPNLPIIGSSLRNAVISASNALGSWAGKTWDTVLKPAADLILAPVTAVSNLIADTTNTLGDLADTETWIVGTYVPREIASAVKTVDAAITHNAQRITADFQQAEKDIDNGIKAAETVAAAALAAAVGTLGDRITHNAQRITDDFAQAEADITAGVTTAEAWAATRISALAADTASSIARALSTAEADIAKLAGTVDADVSALTRAITAAETTAITTAVGIITTDIDQAATAAAATVTGAIDGAIDAAAGEFTDIVAGLRAIDWADVTDIAAAVTATGAIATTLTRYLSECGMPNCRNLGGLGRFLEDLLSDASLAALLAMLVAMIRDPEAAASETISDIGGLASGTINLVTSLVGV